VGKPGRAAEIARSAMGASPTLWVGITDASCLAGWSLPISWWAWIRQQDDRGIAYWFDGPDWRQEMVLHPGQAHHAEQCERR
jgi:hypothetical protein